MTHSVDDIAELIRYHLVLSEDNDDQADRNLTALIGRVESMMTRRPSLTPIEWYHCDRCGCSVDADILAEDGSNFTPDGDFLCSSCLYPDEE